MTIAIICLLILGKFEPRLIFSNLIGWGLENNLYVSFAWYIKLYLLLLIFLPLIRLLERKWKKNIIIDITIYILLPIGIFFVSQDYMDETHSRSFHESLFSSLLFLFYWFPLFAEGLIFAKFMIYKKIKTLTNKISKVLTASISILIFVCVLYLRNVYNKLIFADYFYIPFCVAAILLLAEYITDKIKDIILYLGKRSLLYWLLSSMFFVNTAEFLPLITWPRLSFLILIWIFVLLTPFVFSCDWVSNKFLSHIFKAESVPKTN